MEQGLEKIYVLLLAKLCNACSVLPTSYNIPGDIELIRNHPHKSGGFADVWEGIYGDEKVAIKALKIYETDDRARMKKVSASQPNAEAN